MEGFKKLMALGVFFAICSFVCTGTGHLMSLEGQWTIEYIMRNYTPQDVFWFVVYASVLLPTLAVLSVVIYIIHKFNPK